MKHSGTQAFDTSFKVPYVPELSGYDNFTRTDIGSSIASRNRASGGG
ncbi:hypothetical protein O9H85_22700 [Paenibacillus filicis]|uniref:Uncharacterized protein n=1 Tax=Paenibacillus gyeongsangnamensis TaxID=3388067 RepID=A0ABT4QE84_9BACL|nr:hypothetical protein [Paenibacillus filicis]MCZ8515177.1 hypothetical protein [Paenibacillus filicis]